MWGIHNYYNLWDLPTKSSNNPKTAGFLGTPRALFRGTPCKNERGFLTYGYLSNLKLVRSSSITHHTHWHYNQLSEVQTAKSSFMFWICGKNWGLIGHSETIMIMFRQVWKTYAKTGELKWFQNKKSQRPNAPSMKLWVSRRGPLPTPVRHGETRWCKVRSEDLDTKYKSIASMLFCYIENLESMHLSPC